MDEQIVADRQMILEPAMKSRCARGTWPRSAAASAGPGRPSAARHAVARQRRRAAETEPAAAVRIAVRLVERGEHRHLVIAHDEAEAGEGGAAGAQIFDQLRRMRPAIDQVAEQHHLGGGGRARGVVGLDAARADRSAGRAGHARRRSHRRAARPARAAAAMGRRLACGRRKKRIMAFMVLRAI